ncbi:unnamed protein product, partial [marine sediment metagenome]
NQTAESHRRNRPLTQDDIGERKIAIVVKGCDSRALAVLNAENGFDRDKLVVIGVSSSGVVDLDKIEARFPNAVSPAEITVNGNNFVVSCEGETSEIPQDELLASKCQRCKNAMPVIYDVLIGEELAPHEDNFEDISAAEALTMDEKEAKWKDEFFLCIRCYACRNTCPLCYCSDCMLDRLQPQFIRRSVEVADNSLFHITRAFHLAGRCIECGECERVCPQSIPLMDLNRKLAKDVKELFDYEAGTDPEAKPLFGTFNTEDPDEGIL